MISVTLTWAEMTFAASVGIRRHIGALAQGRRDNHEFEGDGWKVHVEGACGEMAVAKALNRYWPASVNTFKQESDLLDGLEVKTRSEHWHALVVRTDDADDRIFVLVTGIAPQFVVRGWFLGADAKREEWLKPYGGRKPAYFVPQASLHPIEALIANTVSETVCP